MIGASDNEAEVARIKLKTLLQDHGCTWNDLPQILAVVDPPDSAGSDDVDTHTHTQTADTPQVNPLDLLLVLIEKHVAIAPDERLAVALWILHTYVYDQFRETPRLALLSPVNGCGKTTLLSLIALLVRYGCSTSNTSAAFIYHTLRHNPLTTWLLDEGDNLQLRHDPVVRAVLNMGHTRGGAVSRIVGGRPLKVGVFSPLAIAAIGTLPFPLLRRSVSINMQRPGPNQKLERLDDASPQWRASSEQIKRWARSCKLAHDPEMPHQLRNRAADNWRVLLAIADSLGHGDEARQAAIKLSANRVYTEPGIALLGDILLVFQQKNLDRLASKELVSALLELNDGDWNEWRGPKEDRPPHRLTQSELAEMLRPFHITPRTIWPLRRASHSRSSRGYVKASFQKAWHAYCRDDTPTHASKNNLVAWAAA